jgi:signal peptidase II
MNKTHWFIAAAGFLLADVVTKLAAVRLLSPHWERPVIPGFFSLTLTTNRGIAFSMLADVDSPVKTVLLTLAAALALAYILWTVATEKSLPWGYGIGLAMIAGGIVGNAGNRLVSGAVVDFLDFHAGAYYWPTFNLADTFICVGAAMVLLQILIMERRRP